ncbi:hypothetical protein DH2020_001718 [Rehmannia glutinosa]|uniref:Nuclear factor related to kappa-B-binding protein second winged helix domain-containing protein n=1 Tax=Rehmannia glutinosa TaxID=99300 RepID=A0ABR0XRP7_REHGL
MLLYIDGFITIGDETSWSFIDTTSFIFKVDRLPRFSLLSLVRDAATRMPESMGTRADICDLIRDSQYVIENIPEKTVNQIVSGALDRLHMNSIRAWNILDNGICGFTCTERERKKILPKMGFLERCLHMMQIETMVDRPPQFSLLSLVRDAAGRMHGGMGTRADICDLIRDSQYVIENIPDKTVNQIVSGVLDRLHTEFDPCVEYIGQWGLWVYVHREAEEEDFTENGIS